MSDFGKAIITAGTVQAVTNALDSNASVDPSSANSPGDNSDTSTPGQESNLEESGITTLGTVGTTSPSDTEAIKARSDAEQAAKSEGPEVTGKTEELVIKTESIDPSPAQTRQC